MKAKLRRQIELAAREFERLMRAAEDPIVRAGLAESLNKLQRILRNARSD